MPKLLVLTTRCIWRPLLQSLVATAEGDLAPNPPDHKVHLAVTHSVARAALESGVAQRHLGDDYCENTNIREHPQV